jgi:hypothetical protein
MRLVPFLVVLLLICLMQAILRMADTPHFPTRRQMQRSIQAGFLIGIYLLLAGFRYGIRGLIGWYLGLDLLYYSDPTQ